MPRKFWGGLGTVSLALVLAIIVWVNAIYQNDRPREDFYGEALSVQVLNAPAGFVATNNPSQSVRVRIRAFSSTWVTLSASDFDVSADWKNLREGLHSVPVQVSCSNRTVTVLSIHPETIYVRLEPVQQITETIIVDLRDQDAIPLGYAVGLPQATPNQVRLSGPASVVDSVVRVAVSVSVMNQRATIERVMEPIPLDENGRAVSGLTIEPSSVAVRVAIEKKEGFREVAVRVRTKGQPERGYYVSSLSVVPASVTLVGPPAVIEKLSSLVDVIGEIDISGATRMIAARMALSLPDGVSVVGANEGVPYEVLATVGVDAVTGGTTVELPLVAHRLQEGLSAQFSMRTVDVILTGPAVLLDELQTDLLEAYVDLGGLGPGTHQMRPAVDILVSPESALRALTIKDILPQHVDVIIVQPTPTPTPTATPTETPTPEPTIQPTARPRPTATPTAAALQPIAAP